VWGTARCHCGQYNFWLNIRYWVGPYKTEGAAGRVLVREREVWGTDGGEPTDVSLCNVHPSLTD